jgi:hypothetical protein
VPRSQGGLERRTLLGGGEGVGWELADVAVDGVMPVRESPALSLRQRILVLMASFRSNRIDVWSRPTETTIARVLHSAEAPVSPRGRSGPASVRRRPSPN